MKKWLILSAIVVILMFIVFLGLYFFHQEDLNGEASAFSWRREQDIEKYMIVGGWCWYSNCQPIRAWNIRENEEVHHHKRIYLGETCTTDSKGYRSCISDYMSVPVYEIKVYYDINDWRVGRFVKSEGKGNRDYYWPELINMNVCDVSLQPSSGKEDALLGCERPGSRRDWYWVSIETNVEDVFGYCQIDFATWTDLYIGIKLTARYWSLQHLMDCSSISWSRS